MRRSLFTIRYEFPYCRIVSQKKRAVVAKLEEPLGPDRIRGEVTSRNTWKLNGSYCEMKKLLVNNESTYSCGFSRRARAATPAPATVRDSGSNYEIACSLGTTLTLLRHYFKLYKKRARPRAPAATRHSSRRYENDAEALLDKSL
ncbi:hypothetical protein EVAR_69035_1 [Eumeta japonica]|uniref:Uncharacterized protein n=1 Tax=Eumeta variegata TaxID=151549 RepID=A0A4C1SVI3_EUMVA|nr:hypothetical protein EVAR_69035_1 [Eumeta japonica]